MKKLEMKNYNMILNKKHQKYQHYHEKIDKYEYLTDDEILPSDQSRVIEEAKFTYSSLVSI